MQVTTKIAVDLTRANIGARVNAVRGDGNTRSVEITLLADGKSWTPPEGVEAAIAYRQPGGTKGLYNLLADGTPAISIAGNVATVILAPQMLTASGTVQASLVFNDTQLNRLTTFPFSVSVASNPAAGAQKTEDYLRLQWLEDKLEEYLAELKASGVFDGKPGDNGVTFTPSVAENGDLSWTNDGSRPNPPTVNIMGPKPVNGVDYGTPEEIAGIAQQAVLILQPDLSQIKDELSDKLPKSPANWDPWTAEEQAAARERMGVDKAWVLKGTLTTDNKDVGVTVDLTDCSEIAIKCYIVATGNSSLDTNLGILAYQISASGDRTSYVRCVNSPFGIDPIVKLYGAGNTTQVGANVTAYTLLDNHSVSDINKFSFGAPSVIKSCNIQIYAR